MFAGKRGLDERLTTTQILLQQQEEAVRRGDRERRALSDRVKDLERALQASEQDKKHTQVHTPCIRTFSHDRHKAVLNSGSLCNDNRHSVTPLTLSARHMSVFNASEFENISPSGQQEEQGHK